MKFGRYGRLIDDKGTVSFALIAVLLILLSIISVTYMARIDRINRENQLKKERITILESNLEKVYSDIKSRIRFIAIKSVYESRDKDKELENFFSERVNNYILEKIEQGGWKIGEDSVYTSEEDYRLNIQQNKKAVSEIQKIVTMSSQEKYNKIRNDVPGNVGVVNKSFSYELKGYINLKIESGKTELDMNKNRSFETDVEVPYPFFDRKIQSFQDSLNGKSSDIGRMMRYILTTLAQYRVLRGYGMEEDELTGTENVITKSDIETALNLALLLEMCYKFRSYDPESLDAFEQNSSVSKRSKIKDLVENYTQNGLIDPSDIVSLFYGYGYDDDIVKERNSRPIDTSAIIAQSLYSILDQFLVKYLEYFGLDIWGELIYDGIQFLDGLIRTIKDKTDSLLDWAFHKEDKKEVTDKQIESMKRWVEKIFIKTGLGSPELIRNNFTLYNKYKGRRVENYPGLPDNYEFNYEINYKSKLTSKDHRWYSYDCSHDGIHNRKRGDTCDEKVEINTSDSSSKKVRCGAQEIIIGYDYIEGDVEISLEEAIINFRSKNILNTNRDIWEELFKEIEKKVDIDYLQKDLKETLKKVINNIAENIMDNSALNSDRYIKVNPTDKESLLNSIQQEVTDAVQETVSYYRENTSKINEIVRNNLNDNRRIKVLKDWLNENYEEIVGKEEYINQVIRDTAYFLTDEDNEFLNIEPGRTKIIQSGINDASDMILKNQSKVIDRKNVSFIVQNGGVKSYDKIDQIIEDLREPVEDAFEDIKRREVSETDKGNYRSEEDGLIIQALDAYQYGDVSDTGAPQDVSLSISNDHPYKENGGNTERTSRKNISSINKYVIKNDTNEYTPKKHKSIESSRREYLEEEFEKKYFALKSLKNDKIRSKPSANFDYYPKYPTTLDRVSFEDSSTDNGSILNRTWNIEDCGIFYEKEFTYNFSDDGNYDVILNVTDEEGNFNQTSKTIHVNNTAPFVEMEINPNIDIKTDQNITFNQTSHDVDGEIVNKTWYFGDGKKSDKSFVNHSYSDQGSYDVILKVWDDDSDCTTVNRTLNIENRPPLVKFNSSASVITEGETVSFKDKSVDLDGDIVNWTWSFGDGSFNYSKNTSHIFNSPGIYNVSLTVTDDDGSSNSTSEQILVDDSPYVKDISPDSGSAWDVDQSITVEFSESVKTSSLIYYINPDIDFELIWSGDDEVKFIPKKTYDRTENYELKIIDIVDIDNSTASSLKQDVSINWTVKDFNSVDAHYPFMKNRSKKTVPVGRSIVIIFSEPVKDNIDLDSLIESDEENIDWSYTLASASDNKVLQIDHSPFSYGEEIDLKLHLQEIMTESDGTVVTENGNIDDTSLDIRFRTKGRRVYPKINEITFFGEDDNRLKVSFNKKMDKESFSYRLYPTTSGKNVEKSWDEDNTELNLYFDSLQEDQRYKLYIDIRCREGFTLNSTKLPFTFSIKDRTNPEVEYFSHSNNEGFYLSQAPVKISFSKSMDPEGFDFLCKPTVLNWKEKWNDENTTLSLYHENFAPNKEYKFEILQAKDEYGNSINIEDKKIYNFKISKKGEEIQANLIEEKVFSIIGKGAEKFSLFSMLESFMTRTTSNIIMSDQMTNLEYRLPLSSDKEFEYWSDYKTNKNKGSGRKLKLNPDIDPDYLKIEDKIDISDPKGVHYTKINEIADRPFETTWDIDLSDVSFQLDLTNDKYDIILDGSKKRITENRTCRVNLSFSVTVSSGWDLEGVGYEVSNDILSDAVDFIKRAWGVIKKSVSYLIDGIQKILNIFDRIVDFIKDSSDKIIQMLGNMIRQVVVELISKQVSSLTDLVESNIPNFKHEFDLLGMTLSVDTNKNKVRIPNHNGLVERHYNVSLAGGFKSNDFDFNLNILENNVVCFGKFTVGDLEADWQIDPLFNPESDFQYSIYDAWFNLQGETDNSYLNLTSPEESSNSESLEVSLGEYTPIDKTKIPIGPVVVTGIDLGMSFEYENVNETTSLFTGMLDKVYRDSMKSMDGTSFSFQYIIDFVRTLIREFIDEVISFVKNFVKSIVIFFEACINGIDVELTFGINDSQAVFDFVEWISKAVRDIILDIVDMDIPSINVDPPDSLFKYTEIEVETGITDNVSTYFNANLPVLASLADINLGRWRINFGVKMPDMKLIDGVLIEK
ncbi:MAG: PKD domain-containing protein [Thermoplasmata archaeon]